MITQTLRLITEADHKARETYIGCEILREAVENMQAQGWGREEIETFIRDMLEE